MGLEAEIRTALETNLAPTLLEVVNESHLHAGHAGDDGSGESHWRIVIAAISLDEGTRLAKHRAIHTALGKDIIGRLHALAIEIKPVAG